MGVLLCARQHTLPARQAGDLLTLVTRFFSVLLNHFPVQRQATSDRGRRHDRHQNHPRTGRLSEDSFPAPR